MTRNRATIAVILDTFTTTSTSPPPAVKAAADRLDAVTDAYANRPKRGTSLATAIIAAIERDEDPAADPEVQRVLAQRQMPDTDEFIREQLEAEVHEAMRAGQDELVDIWRGPFRTAAEALEQAHSVLGPVDLGDTTPIIRRGPEHAAAWGEAQGALATIETIKQGWNMLRMYLTHQPRPKTYAMATVAAVDPDTCIDKQLAGLPADPWAALGLGLTLELPYLGDFDRLVASVQSTAAERHAAAQTAATRRPSYVSLAPDAA